MQFQIQVPNGPVRKPRLPAQEEDLERSVDTGTERGDDLNSLRMMAEKVARSTRDAMQKLTLKGGKDTSLLEQAAETAQRVAKSTGDALQTLTSNREEEPPANGGELQRTVERVARSTTDALQLVTRAGRQPDESDGSSREEGEEEDLLEMARQTAKQVAQSTSDSVKRLTDQKEEEEEEEEEEEDLLKMARQTAKQVAQFTSDSVKRLTDQKEEEEEEEEEEDLLEMARQTAKQVAQSTSDSVKKLTDQKKEEEEEVLTMAQPSADIMASSAQLAMMRSNRDHHVDFSPDTDHDASSSWLDTLTRGTTSADNADEDCGKKAHETIRVTNGHGDGSFHAYHTQDNGDVTRRLPLLPSALPGHVINGANTFMLPHPVMHGNDARKLPFTLPQPVTNGDTRKLPFTPSILPQPVTNGDTRKLPFAPSMFPQSVTNGDTRKLLFAPSMLPQSVTNGDIRKLPFTPFILPQLETNNGRKLHSQTVTNGYSAKQLPLFSPILPQYSARGDSPKGYPRASQPVQRVTNGYKHLTNGFKSADSDSEYSTTESVDFTPQLQAPVHQEAWPVRYSSDLKTDPMKRMSHTAEMVAESTGKAVHRLTSTLSDC